MMGFAVSAAALWASLAHANIRELGHALWRGHYGWLIPIFLLMNLSFLLRAFFWKTTLSVRHRVSVGHLYSSVIVGVMANNILPFRAGELVRIAYTRQIEGIAVPILLTTVFMERFFDVTMLTGVIFLDLFLVGGSTLRTPAIVLGCIVLGFFLGGAVLIRRHLSFFSVFLGFFSRWPAFRDRLQNVLITAMDGFSSLRSIRETITLFLLSLGIWIGSLVSCYFFLRIFDISMDPVPMTLSLLLYTSLAFLVPASPGGIGVVQLATVYALRGYHVEDSRSLALSVVFQIVPFLFTMVAGWYFIHRDHFSLFGNRESPI
jgi:hypothetical protein